MRLPSMQKLLVGSMTVAALAAAVASCHKDSGDNSNDPNRPHEQTPKEYFVEQVYPRIAGGNACGGCHAGPPGTGSQFIDVDANKTYGRIERTVGLIAAPAKSSFMTYQHVDQTAAKDQRSRLTGDQANVVGIWLGMEAISRKLPG